MEKVLFQFNCHVLRVFNDGFNAILEDNYLIKYRDNRINYPFNINDNLSISIENVEKERKDIFQDSILIYVVVSSFISNGFIFKDTKENSSFFWRNTRGMLTHRIFEDSDIFQKDALLRIRISKI